MTDFLIFEGSELLTMMETKAVSSRGVPVSESLLQTTRIAQIALVYNFYFISELHIKSLCFLDP